MRRRPATSAASLRGFLRRGHRERWNDRFSPTALDRSAAFAKPFAGAQSCDRRPAATVGQRPCLTPKSKRGGGRNARATSRARRASDLIPQRFTLENHRLPLALPQSFCGSGTLTFSLSTLSPTSPFPATQNLFLAVQNLWTFRLPCGRTRKT